MPDHFGDPAAEYRAARERIALFERHDLITIRLAGADALDLLHRITTADLAGLAVGASATAVLVTEKARVLDWLEVRRREFDLILIGAACQRTELLAWLDRMIIMEEVTVEDLSDGWRIVDVVGPSVGVARSVGPADEMAGLAAERLDRGEGVRAGRLAHESLRLEERWPLVGRELTLDTNPLEARLHDSISFTKGCYPGQEVIARMITYKSLKRTLCAFDLGRPAPELPAGQSWPLIDGGAVAARLTTTGWSYGRERWMALGFARNELATPGMTLIFEASDGPLEATVLEGRPNA